LPDFVLNPSYESSMMQPMNAIPIYSTLAGDPDLGELVEMFVAEMPDRIDALETESRNRDWPQLTSAAHQLKGAAGSYGFSAITPYAARLEAAAREGSQEEAILAALSELLARCRGVQSTVAPVQNG
jgi:histidine phosphotransfer protein HptB